ncbi:Bax inhibitor-1/YccA family protein [Parvularcula sp. IMCC14364]|uniref:Bax inhibitor-1/YccA family protein n=1 Tax=Parvularcula sp. IMCC14364 TaxID=3067902 RepID=UPI0027403416|nr:Bax inhibitor-1/YccA family protein [Parvularcula sp. IMCC14364]
MNDFNRPYQADTTTTGVAYDEGLRSFMLGVYNYMTLGIAGTALIAMFMIGNPGLVNSISGVLPWLPFIGIIGLGFIAPRIIATGSPAVAHGAYWVYVFMWSMLIGPVVAMFVGVGWADLVYQAFFAAAAVFAGASLYGYTTKRDLSGMSQFLFMAGIGLLAAIILNFLFFKSGLFGFLTSCAVVLFASAVTMFETQMIKHMYREGMSESNSRASILGAFMLYGSFATLFINILNILGFARD